MAMLPASFSFPSAKAFHSPMFVSGGQSAPQRQGVSKQGQLDKQRYLFKEMLMAREQREGRLTEMAPPVVQPVPAQVVSDDDKQKPKKKPETEQVAEFVVFLYAYSKLVKNDFEVFTITEVFKAILDDFKVPSMGKLYMMLAMNSAVQNLQLRTSLRAKRYTEEFCRQPLDVGTGHEAKIRYYYDPDKDRCIAFTYMGTGGNKNKFKQKDSCELHCRPHSDEGKAEYRSLLRYGSLLEIMDFVLSEARFKDFLRCLINVELAKTIAKRTENE